eukprot:6834680-Prorocentrum_lima.AAC.1
MVELRLGRIRATINSTEAWADETQQLQLLQAAQAARATWADARMVFNAYQAAVQAHARAEDQRDESARQAARSR